jgi:hypothetical protein
MVKLLYLAAILLSSTASAQINYGVGGSGTSMAAPPSGGGGFAAAPDGAEDRVTELVGQGLIACGEPLNLPAGNTITTTVYDTASSNNTTECWGRGSGYMNWDATPTYTAEATTNWGNVATAMRSGGTAWPMTLWVPDFPSENGATCWRFYFQATQDYGNTGGCETNCGGQTVFGECTVPTTWRNKLMQSGIGGQIQVEDEGGGDSLCESGGNYGTIRGTLDNGAGEGSTIPLLGPSSEPFTFAVCKDGPCRIEFCVDGNTQTRTNLVYRARAWSQDTGLIYTTTPMGPFNDSAETPNPWVNGGDWFHSGTGQPLYGMLAAAHWPTDTDQWIGCAEEIEGIGCAD